MNNGENRRKKYKLNTLGISLKRKGIKSPVGHGTRPSHGRPMSNMATLPQIAPSTAVPIAKEKQTNKKKSLVMDSISQKKK